MIVAIHQPQYLPWLGYFHKLLQADVFCFLDNVQYKKNEWQNRNRIKTAQGRQWITVPVKYRFPQTIRTVKINNTEDWNRKHLQTLMTHYRKAPFYSDFIGFFQGIYSQNWEYLFKLNVALVNKLIRLLGIDSKKTVLASELKNLSDDPTERLIDICESLGGDTYLSGPDGANYLDVERFTRRQINIIFQEFTHPVYPQLYGEFLSHLSVVDLLFNCGPESIKILQA